MIITGNHSILIDIIKPNVNKTINKNKTQDTINIISNSIHIHKTFEIKTDNKIDKIMLIPKMKMIGNKYRLPAKLDQRAQIYNVPGIYTIYHMALENESDDIYDAIYANGLLVESTCKNDLIKSGFKII